MSTSTVRPPGCSVSDVAIGNPSSANVACALTVVNSVSGAAAGCR